LPFSILLNANSAAHKKNANSAEKDELKIYKDMKNILTTAKLTQIKWRI